MNESGLVLFQSDFGLYTLVIKSGAKPELMADVIKNTVESFQQFGADYYGAGEAASRALVMFRQNGIGATIGVNGAESKAGFQPTYLFLVRNRSHTSITVTYSGNGRNTTTDVKGLANAVKPQLDLAGLVGKLVRFQYSGGSESGNRVVRVGSYEDGLLKGQDLSKPDGSNYRNYKPTLIQNLEVIKV